MSISKYISVHSGSYKIGLDLVNFMTQNSMILWESINSKIRTTLLLIRCQKLKESQNIWVSSSDILCLPTFASLLPNQCTFLNTLHYDGHVDYGHVMQLAASTEC